jgi:hypothetical protein
MPDSLLRSLAVRLSSFIDSASCLFAYDGNGSFLCFEFQGTAFDNGD